MFDVSFWTWSVRWAEHSKTRQRIVQTIEIDDEQCDTTAVIAKWVYDSYSRSPAVDLLDNRNLTQRDL